MLVWTFLILPLFVLLALSQRWDRSWRLFGLVCIVIWLFLTLINAIGAWSLTVAYVLAVGVAWLAWQRRAA